MAIDYSKVEDTEELGDRHPDEIVAGDAQLYFLEDTMPGLEYEEEDLDSRETPEEDLLEGSGDFEDGLGAMPESNW